MRVLVDLASRTDGRPVQSGELAQRHQIPSAFLDQILLQLRRGGVVRSVRGASGGFLLAHQPTEITLASILQVLHGELELFKTAEEPPQRTADSCAVLAFWEDLQADFSRKLENTTLQDLVDRQKEMEAARALMYYI